MKDFQNPGFGADAIYLPHMFYMNRCTDLQSQPLMINCACSITQFLSRSLVWYKTLLCKYIGRQTQCQEWVINAAPWTDCQHHLLQNMPKAQGGFMLWHQNQTEKVP